MFAFSSQQFIESEGVWERNVHMVSHIYINHVLSLIQLTDIVVVSLNWIEARVCFLGCGLTVESSPHTVLDETFTYLRVQYLV